MRKGTPISVTDPETGFVYPSMQQYGLAVGLGHSAISKRKCTGKLSPEMIAFPGNLKNIPAQDHEGRRFESITAMCRFWKIPPETFRRRHFYLGWSLKKSLTQKPNRPRIDIVIDEIHFFSFKQIADYLQISKNTIAHRIYKGWTPEELKLPADYKGPKRQKKEAV